MYSQGDDSLVRGKAPGRPGDQCACDLGKMRVRTNSETGDKFLGCSNWPRCDVTAPIEEGFEDDDGITVERATAW